MDVGERCRCVFTLGAEQALDPDGMWFVETLFNLLPRCYEWEPDRNNNWDLKSRFNPNTESNYIRIFSDLYWTTHRLIDIKHTDFKWTFSEFIPVGIRHEDLGPGGSSHLFRNQYLTIGIRDDGRLTITLDKIDLVLDRFSRQELEELL